MKTLGYLIIAAVWFNKSTIFGPLVWKQLGLEADSDLIFGMWVYSDELPIKFVILSLLLRDLEKGETFASLLNIHGRDICVVPTHLVFTRISCLVQQVNHLWASCLKTVRVRSPMINQNVIVLKFPKDKSNIIWA
jgi:hypothetical protein